MDSDKTNHQRLREQLCAVLERFHEVFSGGLWECNMINHEIKVVPEFTPKKLKSYRTPELLRKGSNQICDMLAQGIIVPSQSPMVSPLV